MHYIDAKGLDEIANDPPLRRLGGEVNDQARCGVRQPSGQILAKMKQGFVQPSVFDEVQTLLVIWKLFDQFGLVAGVDDQSHIDISGQQKPKVVEWDESFAAEEARRVIRDDDDAHGSSDFSGDLTLLLRRQPNSSGPIVR